MSAPGHVRLDDLLRVCTSGDLLNNDLVAEMLTLFIGENGRRINAALAAAAADNPTDLRLAVHAIKGSAGLIGAERLGRLASDIEARVVTGLPSNTRRDTELLRDEYNAVVQTLRNLFPNLPAN